MTDTKTKNKMLYFIASCYLVLMCIQYIPIEGWGVSPLKVMAMCIAPLILVFRVPHFSKAVYLGLICIVWLFLCMYMQFDSPRLSTLGYSVMFFVCYMMFYNLVHADAFSTDNFSRLMRGLLTAYIGLLFVQQMLSIVGMSVFPLLNLYAHNPVLKCQSLSWEPSSSARIMGVAFYAFLKMEEFSSGHPVGLKELFFKHRILCLTFPTAMLSMASGTAMVVLGILSFYFVKKNKFLWTILVIIGLGVILPNVDYEPLNRAYNTAEATMTLDAQEVIEADNSAAVRILPLLNMLDMDFTTKETWFGYGCDYGNSQGFFSTERTLCSDYGFIHWLLGLLFVFSCCIRPFLSLPTLMFWLGVGGGVGNISYCWGILMIFTVVTYFYEKKQNSQRTFNLKKDFSNEKQSL